MHDLGNVNKAFIDSLDIDAQLIRKGKRMASLEALSKKIGWQDNAFQTWAKLTERGQGLIDSLDMDAQLIRKGKRVASLEDWIEFPRCGHHRTSSSSFRL